MRSTPTPDERIIASLRNYLARLPQEARPCGDQPGGCPCFREPIDQTACHCISARCLCGIWVHRALSERDEAVGLVSELMSAPEETIVAVERRASLFLSRVGLRRGPTEASASLMDSGGWSSAGVAASYVRRGENAK